MSLSSLRWVSLNIQVSSHENCAFGMTSCDPSLAVEQGNKSSLFNIGAGLLFAHPTHAQSTTVRVTLLFYYSEHFVTTISLAMFFKRTRIIMLLFV